MATPLDPTPVLSRARERLARDFDTRGVPFEAVVEAARAGLAPRFAGPLATYTPILPHRLGERFEAAAERADALAVATGRRPTVILVRIGDAAGHAAPVAWLRDALAAGGLASHACSVREALPVRVRGHLTILAGAAGALAAEGPDVAAALLAGGALRVWCVAGAVTPPLAAAGVERALREGDDVAAALEAAIELYEQAAELEDRR